MPVAPSLHILNGHVVYRERKDTPWQLVTAADPATNIKPGYLIIVSQRAFHHPSGGGLTAIELDGVPHVAITVRDIIGVVIPGDTEEELEHDKRSADCRGEHLQGVGDGSLDGPRDGAGVQDEA